MAETASDIPYFARSVAQLTPGRPMQAIKAVYGAQGIKILDQGAKVSPGLYERLLGHHPTPPLEDALEIAGSVNGANLRSAAEAVLQHSPVLASLSDTTKCRTARAIQVDWLATPSAPGAGFFLWHR
jgi:hypothetical protein